MKVLVSAYACEPDKGSEPGVGWHWICEIAKNNEVWVCTKANNRESIERELDKNPNNHLHFIYVDLPKWLTFWKKGQQGVHAYYYLWQFAALKHALTAHRDVNFDIGHHVTFVNAWLWTFLALMPLPYIWGPIGTNSKMPPQLLRHTGERIRNSLRYNVQAFIRIMDPLYWISALRASLILVINRETQHIFPLYNLARRKIHIETAIGIEQPNDIKKRKNNKLIIIFIGRFLLIKGIHLAMEAFAKFARKKNDVTFQIIGEGPLEKSLRDFVKSADLTDKVEFIHWMPRNSVLGFLQQADVFLFPTMEGAGMVVLEAMASGLPVVCLDFGGPSTMVDEKSGFRIKIKNYNETIELLVQAMQILYENKDIRRKMGSSALKRVSERFTWNKKSQIINIYYNEIIDRQSRNDQP
ncbi:MAG TPA: glycosyltransferase family 4 protein [Smithellaceae bacterium]|nr:glycosyltransferase family 4 protein [Smithellaceae bacterium]